MDIGVLGSGGVGRTLATRVVARGHSVTIGVRVAGGQAATGWVASATGDGRGGGAARQGTFADAARAGAVVGNATNGTHALEALTAAGAEHLDGKVLIDVANPLDFSGGCLPRCRCATPQASASRSNGPSRRRAW